MRTAGRSIKADVSGRYSVIPSVGISVLQELCVVLAPDLFSQERVEQGRLFPMPFGIGGTARRPFPTDSIEHF